MPCLADAILIPSRMIEDDERGRIARERLEHRGDVFDLRCSGDALQLGEDLAGPACGDIVNAQVKKSRAAGDRPFNRNRNVAALIEDS